VAETHALTLSHLGRAAALQVIQELVDGEMRVIRVRPADERRARAILQQYGDKDFSYTDATSFAIMERLGIGTAFTFDEDFHQYGFIDLAQQL
jgi:predicted nucleic acid-binding protein